MYIHSIGVVHRDIKLDNLMLDKNGRVKIIDFGIAVMKSELLSKRITHKGTPVYMAPELFQHRYSSIDVDPMTRRSTYTPSECVSTN